jgi:hypothetical protein
MTKVSFASIPGAGEGGPVSKIESANAVLDPSPAAAPASDAPRQLPAKTDGRVNAFSGGDEEGGDDDRTDVRLPRLNIIQGLSGPELKSIKMPDGKNAPDGSLILKKTLYVPQPARIVVAGFSRKLFAEKMPKFGEGKPRYAENLEQVHEFGGTDQWKLSRENKDKDGMPMSRKPWFVPMVTGLLLIQKWDGLAKEDEDHFSAIAKDGTAFAPCVYTVKSTSFGSFYVPLKSENSTGILKAGYYVRYVRLTTAQPSAKAFEPVVAIIEPTNEDVRNLARSIRA